MHAINAAIDRMSPNGNTNVPEGLAWGWRTVSSGEPFTEGRPEAEKGNDKVVIVLTDGANTYSVPSSDPAGNKSTYAAYGYLQPGYNNTGIGRLLTGTSVGQFDYSSGNYTAALDDHMATLCDHAKAANIMVITVSLELSTSNAGENKAIEALKTCASDSRFRKDPTDPSKPSQAVLQRRRQRHRAAAASGHSKASSRRSPTSFRTCGSPADRSLAGRLISPYARRRAPQPAAAFGLRSRNASGMAHSVTSIISLKSST